MIDQNELDRLRELLERMDKIPKDSAEFEHFREWANLRRQAVNALPKLLTAIDTLQAENATYREAVAARKALYIAKRERHDPLADDTLTEYDKVTHTIEAFEWLEAEMAILTSGGEGR